MSNSQGVTSHFILTMYQDLLHGRLNAEHRYLTRGKQQPGQPEATEVLSPTSIPHWPVLLLQPRNKALLLQIFL